MLPQSFETERLLARLPESADAKHLYRAYTSNPAVSRYLMWRPHTELATTEAFVLECIAAAELGTRLPYVLVERGGSVPIGMLEARPDGHTVDLGYVLAPAFWGLGYIPEAISALSNVALKLPEVFRVQAFCDVENRPSQRALEKSGFLQEGRHERFFVFPNLSAEPRPCYMYALCK